MYRVTREIRFCYGHRLLNYEGKCRHLHGHNGRAVITLEALQLDGLGMVVDFSRIKRVVSAWIDDALDHKMILHKDDPALAYLCTSNSSYGVNYQLLGTINPGPGYYYGYPSSYDWTSPYTLNTVPDGLTNTVLLGIYRLEADILSIAVSAGNKRPESFTNPRDQVLLVLKRAPKKASN